MISSKRAELFVAQVEDCLLLSIPYFLIFSITLSNIIIIALFMLSMRRWRNLASHISVAGVLPVVIFFLGIVCLLYSENWIVGLSVLETRLPLVLIPIALYSRGTLTENLMQRFQRHFVYSVLLTFVVLVSIAIFRNIHGQGPDMWFNKWYYHYSDFTEPIGIDPLYLGLFVSWAILLLFFSSENIGLLFSKHISWALLLICCLFLAMIAVRSLIAIVALIIVAFYVKKAIQKNSPMDLAKMGVFIAIIGALSFLLPVTRERFQMLYKGSYSFSTFSIDRFIIWSTAMGEILNEPQSYLLGKGTGSSETVMRGAYERKQINWEFEKKVDTHNQYLNFLMEFGIAGLIIITVWFVIAMKQSLRQDNLGFALMAFFACSMFFENYLNRQKGVVFFALFFCLFTITNQLRSKAKS